MAMYSPYRDTPFGVPGFPIRNPTDQRFFAPPRGLSQLGASFINGFCQGIHYALLLYLTTSLDPLKSARSEKLEARSLTPATNSHKSKHSENFVSSFN